MSPLRVCLEPDPNQHPLELVEMVEGGLEGCIVDVRLHSWHPATNPLAHGPSGATGAKIAIGLGTQTRAPCLPALSDTDCYKDGTPSSRGGIRRLRNVGQKQLAETYRCANGGGHTHFREKPATPLDDLTGIDVMAYTASRGSYRSETRSSP